MNTIGFMVGNAPRANPDHTVENALSIAFEAEEKLRLARLKLSGKQRQIYEVLFREKAKDKANEAKLRYLDGVLMQLGILSGSLKIGDNDTLDWILSDEFNF